MKTYFLKLRTKLLSAVCIVSINFPFFLNAAVLEEVTVTATRRAQSVQDIPYNITVLSGDKLSEHGIGDLNDLMQSIPGAVSADLGGRSGVTSSLVIRGINANDAAQDLILTKPTTNAVSTYLNETPLFFNLKITDVDRVEVLRGPQGTLYGSGAVGGTVRFLFNQPDLDENTLSVKGGLGSYDESGGMNYNFEAIGNMVVSDNVAIRALVGYDEKAGFIDQVSLAQLDNNDVEQLVDPADQLNSPLATVRENDTDDSNIIYSRVSLLWNPSDATSVVASYHRQEDEYDDSQTVSMDPTLGKWENESPRKTAIDRTVDVVSLEIQHDFGFAEFTSATSWSLNESFYETDATQLYRYLGFRGAVGVYGFEDRLVTQEEYTQENETVTQEIRLVSTTGDKWNWMVGAYYSNEEFEQHLDTFERGYSVYQEDAAVGAANFGGAFPTVADFIVTAFGGTPASRNNSNIFVWDISNKFEDIAVFGELTFNVTEDWQMTAGARSFWQDYTQNVFTNFFEFEGFGFAGNITPPPKSFKDQVFKFNTSYQINDETNLYFTWSEGFRRGGSNPIPDTGIFADPNVPGFYNPDKTTNYEIGAKGTLMEGRARYSIAGYLIDWEDIQFNLFNSAGFPAVFNGGKAQSVGIEAEMEVAISDHLTMNIGYGFTNAETTEDFNIGVVPGSQLFVADGADLPGVPKHTLNIAGTYIMPFANGELLLHANVNYRDSMVSTVEVVTPNAISSPSNFAFIDDYWLMNVSANYRNADWNVGVYVKNIFNEQTEQAKIVRHANAGALISPAAAAAIGAGRLSVGTPRSIGINFGYNFDL